MRQDETLVHCDITEMPEYDMQLSVTVMDEVFCVYACMRPHLHEFLERVARVYEVVVFTASQQMYAEQVLNNLDPTRAYIKHRLFRQHCVEVEGNFVKDLRVLGRDLAKTIIVDNSPQAFAYHVSLIHNTIPLIP